MPIITLILLILLGILGISSWVKAQRPSASPHLAKLEQFEGWIGLIGLIWGIWHVPLFLVKYAWLRMRNRPVENKWIGQRISDPDPDLDLAVDELRQPVTGALHQEEEYHPDDGHAVQVLSGRGTGEDHGSDAQLSRSNAAGRSARRAP